MAVAAVAAEAMVVEVAVEVVVVLLLPLRQMPRAHRPLVVLLMWQKKAAEKMAVAVVMLPPAVVALLRQYAAVGASRQQESTLLWSLRPSAPAVPAMARPLAALETHSTGATMAATLRLMLLSPLWKRARPWAAMTCQ